MTIPLPILSCDDCALCCHTQHFPPFMSTELAALPPYLAAEVETLEEAASKGHTGPCPWLNASGRCRHYDLRPEVCRQFEMGGEDCREIRAAHKLP